MPVGRGLMQMSRIHAYHTSTAFGSISPPAGSAQCGQTVTFPVVVTNIDGGPAPNGPFQIVDQVSGEVVATGTITSGTGSAMATFANGALNLVAQFLGIE